MVSPSDPPQSSPGLDRTLAGRLRLVQMRANIKSDKDFAEMAGVSRPTMSAYLSGKQSPRAPVLIRIAEATGTDLAWLRGSSEIAGLSPRTEEREPTQWTELPSSYGSPYGRVEMVAIAEFSSGIKRLELALGRHLDAERRVHLAVRLHDQSVTFLEGVAAT